MPTSDKADLIEQMLATQRQRRENIARGTPGTPPNVVEAMLAGDIATVKVWLAHPYIGDGTAMNAVAIFLLERLEAATSDPARLTDSETGKAIGSAKERALEADMAHLQAERDKSLMVLTHERDEAQTAAAQWRDQLARERVGRQADRDEARQSLALCEAARDDWKHEWDLATDAVKALNDARLSAEAARDEAQRQLALRTAEPPA